MPIGAAIAIGGAAFLGGTMLGSSTAQSQQTGPKGNTTDLTTAATKTAPQSVGQASGQAATAAQTAAAQQRKKAMSGDTLLTGKSIFTTNTPTAGLQPKTLLGGA